MGNSNVKKACIILIIVAFAIGLAACTFPIDRPRPQEGVWYCEELMIKIDFGYLSANLASDCAQKYNLDGTWQNVLCYIDYGNGIWICSEDRTEDYLLGNFKYQNGIFVVTTREDKKIYVFERIDD